MSTTIIKICVLFIILSIVECVVEGNKSAHYVKGIASILLIIAVIEFVITINFNVDCVDFGGYDVTEKTIWDNTKKYIQTETENKLIELCYSNGINVDSITVQLSTDYEKYNIDKITIKGKDALKAKSYISGYLKLGLAYIDIGE